MDKKKLDKLALELRTWFLELQTIVLECTDKLELYLEELEKRLHQDNPEAEGEEEEGIDQVNAINLSDLEDE